MTVELDSVAPAQETAVRCRRCAGTFDSRPVLRDHLIRDHKLGRVQAIVESHDASEAAQGSIATPPVAPPTTEHLQMAKKKRGPRTCNQCGKTGHDRGSCGEAAAPAAAAPRRARSSASAAAGGAAAAIRVEIELLDAKRAKLAAALEVLEA